nr:hypothetical protein [uncultured Bacteroides sp.]
MKHFLLMLMFIIGNISSMFGQTETEHFVYEKEGELFRVFLKGKEEVKTLLSKVDVRLDGHGVDWIVNARAKPFQELINEKVFSKSRMEELEKAEEPLGIYVFFNETGIVFDVYFLIPVKKKSLLTDKELYCIYQKYMGALYDLTGVIAWDENSLSPKERKTFLSLDYFKIPFEDLKY